MSALLTRRHYQVIADAVAAAVSDVDDARPMRPVVEALGRRLGEDNPRYDHQRFLDACALPRDP